MEKIYAAPINADYYAVFVGDKKLTLPLSEADAKKIADRYNGFAELQQANKALSLQVEILSGAYETSRKRVVYLEAEIERIQAEQAEMLQLINAMLAAEKKSNGICDSIDNSGVSYQSAFLSGVLSQMEIIASKNKSAQS